MPVVTVPFEERYEVPSGTARWVGGESGNYGLGGQATGFRVGMQLSTWMHRGQEPAGTVSDPGTWKEVIWEPATPFQARLELLDLEGANLRVVDRLNNRWYLIFPTDFLAAVKALGVKDGCLEGQFKYVKKGSSYGIAHAG